MKRIRHFLAAGLTAYWACGCALASTGGCLLGGFGEGDHGAQQVEFLIAQLFQGVGTEGKDPMSRQLNDTIVAIQASDCRLEDGRAYLNMLLAGLRQGYVNENDWTRALRKVKALRTAFPNEAWPIVAEAAYWYQYAWDARGSGYASTVTPEGWKLFHDRLATAKKVLLDGKAMGSALPNWYELMIEVESGLNDPARERDKTFLEGAGRFKTYLPIYIKMRSYLEPRWGGSWDAVDNLINWSVNNTREVEGLSLYAWLYYGVHYNWERTHDFFRESLVKWPRLRAAYEDVLKRHPNSQWHLNNYAALACEAGDRATFLTLRKRIGKEIRRECWTDHPALEFCDAKYRYAD